MSSIDSATMSSGDWSRYSERLLPQALLAQASRNPDDPLLFAQAYRRLYGRPMLIPPALHDIYRDRHPFVVVRKPAQVGVTELNLNLALWAAATNQGDRGNVLYMMPTEEHVNRLSQRRVQQALDASRPLRELVRSEADATRGPQRVQMRSVGPGVIYFSGAEQPRQYAGIDADLAILDEFDLMKEEALPHAMARLRSSRFARLRVTSTPTIPGFGVDRLMQQSDELHYQLNCPSCGRWVEPEFPANVNFERALVVCDCGAPLPHDLPARWVPSRPDAPDIRGYQLNRLTLPDPPLPEMRMAAAGTVGIGREQFYRQDLGVPYVAADARLTADVLDRCQVKRLPPLVGRREPTLW